MEQIKLSNKNKRQVARDVKRIMTRENVNEVVIIYDVNEENFKVMSTIVSSMFSRALTNKDGYIIYDYYYNDRIEKTTLKDIERVIFE